MKASIEYVGFRSANVPQQKILPEDIELSRKERGNASFGIMTLIVGALALVGLLVYGWRSGQELPVWPALAVVLVNVAAAIKIVLDLKKARQQPKPAAEAGKIRQTK